MEVGPCCLTGAPSIASAAGAFVAGNATGAPAPTKLHEGYPHPPSFDSAWRMEASTSLELPVFHPVPEIPFQGGEPGEAQPSCERNVIDLDDDEIGATQKHEAKEKGADDIPMGYSPGSPVASFSHVETEKPKNTENEIAENKFDKYYHKSLGSMCTCIHR